MLAFVLLRVLLILLLVAANAFFAAAEFSLISVRDTRIQQLIESGRIGARNVQRLHQHLDEVVNGVQLGITMVSLTLGWIGEPMVARLVEALRFVHEVPHAAVYAHGIAIVIAFSLITYLHVLLGELVPKTLALQRSEQRLALYDRSLIALDDALKHKKISRQEYSYDERDLNAFIGAEANYENDLLTKTSTFPEESREVLENIAKYAIIVPAYIIGIAARGLAGSSFSFSP